MCPYADYGFTEIPARYPTLDGLLDVCGTLAHLASWLYIKLPHGWRLIDNADAGGENLLDSRTAQAEGCHYALPRSTAVARHVLNHTIDFADIEVNVPVQAEAKAVD